MNFPIRFLSLIVFFIFSAGTLFGALIDANIHFVWMRPEDARSDFFIKNSNYCKIEGILKSLSPAPQKYRGENPIKIYRKSSAGNYGVCGEVEIPAGVRDCAVILVPNWEVANPETLFLPKVLDLKAPAVKGGELIFSNLSPLTLRVKIRGKAAEKYLPDEARKLHALVAQEESASFSFKILASAASAESAKRSWRYANSMRIVKSQCYYLVALPGEPKDDPEKPPRCELITLRKDEK